MQYDFSRQRWKQFYMGKRVHEFQENAKFISNQGQQHQQYDKHLTYQLIVMYFQTLNQINKCINEHQIPTAN